MELIMRRLAAFALVAFATPLWAAVTFDSSMECGNATAFTLVSPETYSFEIEPDTNSTDRQWFMFDVAGAAGETLTFRLLNTDTTNVRSHWRIARPVYSTDGGDTFSLVTGEASREGTTYVFTHQFTADKERIAFHHPFTWTMNQQNLIRWIRDPHVEHTVIGQSVQTRDINMLRITDAESNPPHGKLGFWIIARQHAAEVTGSFMMEGFIDFVLSDDPRAVNLREHAVINCVPMMNPDGVVAGNYRDNFAGANLNREWNPPSLLESPEVLAVTNQIADWVADGNSYDFFADLHSTSGGTQNYVYHPGPDIEPPLYADPANYCEHLREIIEMVAEHAPDFNPEGGQSNSQSQALSRQRQMFQYGVLALLFEGTYNFPDYGPNQGEHMTPDRHRAIGRALAIALHDYFKIGAQ
jgi:murein tripeptide amidase MpaA